MEEWIATYAMMFIMGAIIGYIIRISKRHFKRNKGDKNK